MHGCNVPIERLHTCMLVAAAKIGTGESIDRDLENKMDGKSSVNYPMPVLFCARICRSSYMIVKKKVHHQKRPHVRGSRAPHDPCLPDPVFSIPRTFPKLLRTCTSVP